MKESHKRNRNPAYKKKYRVTNWKEYEKSLRNRGNLTLWISPSAIKAWKARTEKGREVETIIGCNILNRFLELGRAESVLVG